MGFVEYDPELEKLRRREMEADADLADAEANLALEKEASDIQKKYFPLFQQCVDYYFQRKEESSRKL